jgi:hypothetical protein
MRSTKIDTENNIEVAEEMTNTRSCDDLTIFCARSFEQIEAIRPIWEKMQSQESHPQLDADINRYLSVVKSLGSDVQPYVIVVYQNDTPKAMLIGRVEKKQVPCKIGYYVIFNPWMHCLNIVYGGIIGELTDTFCVALVQKLMEILARREVDVVYVNRLAMDSPLYRHVMKMPNLLCRTRMPKIEQHWIMDVPGDIDSLYKSFVPKTRNTLKRKNRKLEREFKDQLEFVTYNDKNELEQALSAASRISEHTYQMGLGAGFVNDSKTRKFMEVAANQGWFRMTLLCIKGEPCSFQQGFQYGKTYFLGQLGFDPKWKQWNVGTILFKRIMEDLCSDSSIERLDFGFGDAQYKRSFGTRYWDEAILYIFAPRIYPVFVNMLLSLTRSISLLLELIFNKFGLVRTIKRKWRNLLAKN